MTHASFLSTPRQIVLCALLACALVTAGCDALLGGKQDDTTDEIFEAGRQEPTLLNEVEYVPLFPFFSRGGESTTLDAPTDVYVGYDELIYVTDSRGLHVLDLAGRPQNFVAIEGGATSVIQDRRLQVYVTARRDTLIGTRTWDLPVVYRYDGLTTGTPRIADMIWHPFDDETRRLNRPAPSDAPNFRDEEVSFTSVAIQPDNRIYVARRGPVNDVTSIFSPHNTILGFTPEGRNNVTVFALNPRTPTLRSSVFPNDVLTFVQPPQRADFGEGVDFIVAQSPYPNGEQVGQRDSLRYGVLSILVEETLDGTEYRQDTDKLVVSDDPDRGDGFLYEEFKFGNPAGMAFAADGTNYLFVVDSQKDSLFVFNNAGVEGVAPPPGSSQTTPFKVSFGGQGDGALQFSSPEGVAYFERTVYVADTGNNRIARFRLNVDFE